MKKQIIILLLSIFILLFAGVWEINYLNKSSRYILSDIGYSKNAIENDNFELALNHIDEIKNTWNNMKGVWGIFVNHEEIDMVELEMARYKSYIGQKSSDEAKVSADLVYRNIEHVVDSQKLKVENIF